MFPWKERAKNGGKKLRRPNEVAREEQTSIGEQHQ